VTSRAEQYPPLPPNRLARWSKFGKWDTVYFPKFLGIEVDEIRQDYARMRVPYRPEYRQPAGVMHGGVIASLVDSVVVPVIGSGYDEPTQLFTIDLALRFLSPIIEEDAVAEGWIVQRGRSIVFCDVEVRGRNSGKIAASANLVYKVSTKPLVLE
jgi:uncharacterized protein (TIGR00369 family)